MSWGYGCGVWGVVVEHPLWDTEKDVTFLDWTGKPGDTFKGHFFRDPKYMDPPPFLYYSHTTPIRIPWSLGMAFDPAYGIRENCPWYIEDQCLQMKGGIFVIVIY